MDHDQAINFTVESAKTEPSMQGGDSFKSVEALKRICDPTSVSVWAAANNRAAIRLYAETCVFQATPEGIQVELAILESEGFPLPSCGCRGGSCALPSAGVAISGLRQ
jgi:hypothetical protein